jgi:hypothetical protein
MNIAGGHDVLPPRLRHQRSDARRRHFTFRLGRSSGFNAYNQASFGNFKVDNNTIGYACSGAATAPTRDRQDEADYG